MIIDSEAQFGITDHLMAAENHSNSETTFSKGLKTQKADFPR